MNDTSSHYEAASLREELALRIKLQNGLLLFSVGVFALFATAATLATHAAWPIAFACQVALLALALQWCHHGVRTKQIKQYLLVIDQNPAGWEHWLPAHRPKTILGSRWMISTKGVFLGLGLAQGLLAVLLAPLFLPDFASLSTLLWLLSAGFLLTNPKE